MTSSAISPQLSATAAFLGVDHARISTPAELLDKILLHSAHTVESALKNSPEHLAVIRAELRTELLGATLIESESKEFMIDFNGSGDSGNYELHDLHDTAVGAFLMMLGELHINFDWYNNDGGGGDITWNIVTDKVIINGYINITETESTMTEEEF